VNDNFKLSEVERVFSQNIEQFGTVPPQLSWQTKELLRSDGEELSGVGRCVDAKKRSVALLQRATESLKLPLHHASPTLRFIPATQRRHPICVTAEEVELMGEFVNDQVMTETGVARLG
jgi:hypothetical protein